MSTINNRIREVIKNNENLTQKGLAKYLGKADSTISQWLSENRPIPAEYVIPICEYLNISIMWLLSGDISKDDLLSEEQKWLDLYNNLLANAPGKKDECIDFIEWCIYKSKNRIPQQQ